MLNPLYNRAMEELQKDFQEVMRDLVVVNKELEDYIKNGTTVSNRIKLKSVVESWNKASKLVDAFNTRLSEMLNNKKIVETVEVELPYSTPAFKEAWIEWKDYLKEQHDIAISTRAEKRQLYFLKKYAGEKEDYAIELIFYSISRLYRMIYQYSEKELKGKVNENTTDDGEY